MKFESIVFDLDGTLWDTTDACAFAWNLVLAELAIEHREIVGDDVRRVTGKPHDDCIRLTFPHLSPDLQQQLIDRTAVEDNRVIEEQGGILYTGVAEGLAKLAEKYPLYIVSNCQQGYIENFLKLSGLSPLFQDFECFGNTGRPKGENLRSLIDRNNIQYPLMVGDAEGDEAAARFCTIPFAHVTYGFASADSPDLTFNSFDELVNSLLSP